MRIRMTDGRVFQGTGLQIVRAMQDVAFGVDAFTVAEYVDWVARNAGSIDGAAFSVSGATDHERAESLVREMLRTGLAQRM